MNDEAYKKATKYVEQEIGIGLDERGYSDVHNAYVAGYREGESAERERWRGGRAWEQASAERTAEIVAWLREQDTYQNDNFNNVFAEDIEYAFGGQTEPSDQ